MRHPQHHTAADWYRAAFEQTPAPLLVCDGSNLRVLAANGCAGSYGPPPAPGASALLALFSPSDHEAVRAAVARAAAEGEAELAALRVAGADGAARRCDLLCHRLDDGANGAPYVLLALRDRSETLEARRELARLHDVLAVSQEATGLGCCTMDLATGSLAWSDQQYRNLGLEPGSIPPSMDGLLAPVHTEERGRLSEAVQRCIDSGEPFSMELHLTWPDRSEHVLSICGRRVAGGPDSSDWFACATVDITEQHCLRHRLLRTEADLQHAQELAHVGTWAADLHTRVIETTSAETWRIFREDPARHGRGGQPFTLDDLTARIHPADLPRVLEERDRMLATPGRCFDIGYRLVHEGGEVRHVHSQAEVVRDREGEPARVVGIIRDVTELKRAEEKINRLAFFDETTGLPNRVSMRQHLEALFNAGDGIDQPIALLAVELAHFREINLTLGHLNGDDLLRDVANRLGTLLGEDSHFARVGNAQFTAVLRGTQAYHAGEVAERIAQAFESTFLIAGVKYEINAHIGIALAPGHARNPTDLLRKADVAVFQARRDGRKTMLYDTAQDPYDPRRLALLGQFRNAIADGQIELYCQPKVAMANGEVIGAEALVRWRHPELGLVPPSDFVPLIESTELIHALTNHMLQASLRQSHVWRKDGLALPIAVNLSTRNLTSGSLPGDLRILLSTWGATPDWLGLEITESSLIVDPDASIAQLNALSNMGFQLYIDDFGTGYSSLNYLTRLPVDVIKIDHGFTTNMLVDRRAGAIVKATIDLAHDLGMAVVAEGTATREIWDALLACGCDEAQGYYVAPPLPARDLPDWVRQNGLRH